MATLSGLQSGFFTDIDVVDVITINGDAGTANQVLTSDGTNTSYQDPTLPAVSELLTAGTGIDITDTGNPETISTDIDADTIVFNGNSMEVAKVPNALTISQNGTIIDTFDGATAKTIDLEGKYIAGDGIDISGHPVPHIEADTDEITISHNVGGAEKLQVLKVPNTLTFTGYDTGTFDGSAPLSINLVNTEYTAGDGMTLTGTTFSTINDGITIRNTLGFNEVLRVPNALTAGTNINFSSGTTYDGSSAITISATDTDTTYQGGTGISIDTATNPDTINCASIPNTALQNSTISGKSLGDNLSTLTFYSSTGAFLTSYNGADPPTSVTLDGDTTYQGGTNISIDTSTNPDTINLNASLTSIDSITFTSTSGATALTGNNYPSNPTTATNLDLSSATNVFPKFVGGSEILKSISYIDNTSQNFNRIFNTSFEYFFSGSQDSGSDTLEIDFTATSTTGYCEFGFYANTLTSGMVFMTGIAAATGGTSPFSTALGSGAVSIDAYKIGLFDGDTTRYSLKEILDFTSFENTYITSKYFFNNLTIGTRYRMALYGRCHNSGSIYINAGGRGTTGTTNRSFHQPAFMKFYEYDSSIGGARTTGSGGGGGSGK
tara:strand:+ start:1138 stop:2958 length:1821 start_codon:yes stop_codon:yes gene_type:complete